MFVRFVTQLPRNITLALIKVYKLIPLPKACRFFPSCSDFTSQAIKKHGFLYGSLLSLKRILRCNSLFSGGSDPVP